MRKWIFNYVCFELCKFFLKNLSLIKKCHLCVWEQRKDNSGRDKNDLQIHRGKKELKEGREKGKESSKQGRGLGIFQKQNCEKWGREKWPWKRLVVSLWFPKASLHSSISPWWSFHRPTVKWGKPGFLYKAKYIKYLSNFSNYTLLYPP